MTPLAAPRMLTMAKVVGGSENASIRFEDIDRIMEENRQRIQEKKAPASIRQFPWET
jgi:hypothetical protein